MRLNGWQRLWVIVTALWILPVVATSYRRWPTTSDIPNAEVYMGMKPEDGRRLADYNEIVPPLRRVYRPEQFQSPPSTLQEANDQASVSVQPSEVIDVHVLTFSPGLSREDMNRTDLAFDASLTHILAFKTAAFVGEVIAAWMVPAAALYALGWVVAWVRRGFGDSEQVH